MSAQNERGQNGLDVQLSNSANKGEAMANTPGAGIESEAVKAVAAIKEMFRFRISSAENALALFQAALRRDPLDAFDGGGNAIEAAAILHVFTRLSKSLASKEGITAVEDIPGMLYGKAMREVHQRSLFLVRAGGSALHNAARIQTIAAWAEALDYLESFVQVAKGGL